MTKKAPRVLPRGMFWKETHKKFYFKRSDPVTKKRKDVPLARDYGEAEKKYHELLAGLVDPTSAEVTVLGLIDEYLVWSKKNHSKDTHKLFYRYYLEGFAASLKPALKVADLKPFHVTRWLDERYPPIRRGEEEGASTNTRHNAVRAVKRVFNWAVKQGLLPKSPIATLERPPQTARDVYYEPGQYEAILAKVRDQEFKDVCRYLRHTGCRPEEMRLAEAKFFDRENRCLVLPRAKSKGSKEQRVIRLDREALEIVQRLALKYPEGPLFRNTWGNGWTKEALNNRCDDLSKKLGFRVTPYIFRHTFITDALVAGLDIQTVAKLVGHKDLRMIAKVYEHLDKRGDYLQKKLEDGTRGVA